MLKFIFLGVTTHTSSIQRIFPRWMAALGHPEILLEGVDLPLHDRRENYEKVVSRICYDPQVIGGLVTTHKVDVYHATQGLFDFLDPYARLCGEITYIIKQDGLLMGYASDVVNAGSNLDEILEEDYFSRTGGQVLCFGAGGVGRDVLLHFSEKASPNDRPAKMNLVEKDSERISELTDLIAGVETDIQIEILFNQDSAENDRLMTSLPDYSLVINASGMGKDTPGSPITDRALFPRHGVAWEINYRGELDFKRQALSQAADRDLRVEDGWNYFLHGWSLVVAQMLHIELSPELFAELAKIAEKVR